MRQFEYRKNLSEQVGAAVKRIVQPMLERKSFRCLRALIMDMIKKIQFGGLKVRASSAADQYSHAFLSAGERASRPLVPRWPCKSAAARIKTHFSA